jgi:hypothetical protein
MAQDKYDSDIIEVKTKMKTNQSLNQHTDIWDQISHPDH